MSELDVVRRLRERVLTKVPNEARHAVEIEIKRVEDEVSLRHDVLSCTVCPLAESCTNKVPGIGPIDASVMLVGAAPGRNEDEQGVPFVGDGGEMLNAAINAVGWNREDLYLTNIVKCHPPNNRNPLAGEIASCFQHLKKEIEVIRPKVIVALGATAASTLIHPDFKITQENGHWFELSEGTRGIAVYDPSYLLRLGNGTQRQNQAKWEVFNGLQKVKQYQDAGFVDDFG
jgi:uracil-DNA glycosylase